VLNLTIGPWMRHRNIFDFNRVAFTEISELMQVKVGSQIHDDGVEEAKAV
jgi:hypothetical protein